MLHLESLTFKNKWKILYLESLIFKNIWKIKLFLVKQKMSLSQLNLTRKIPKYIPRHDNMIPGGRSDEKEKKIKSKKYPKISSKED